MSKTPHAMHYLALCAGLQREPSKEFSLLLYLADWKSCLLQDRPITNLKWWFGQIPTTDYLPPFPIRHGWRDTLADLFGQAPHELDKADVAAIKHVVAKTRQLRTAQIITLVKSTFPAFTAEPGDILDLPKLARRYAANPIFGSATTAISA